MSPSVAIIGTRGFPSYYGGFETAVRELAPYLVRQGWDVTVYGRRKAIRKDDALTASGVVSRTTPGLDFKSISTLSYGLTASAHTALKKPDVALVMNVANGYYLPLLKARGIPTLVNVDGMEWERAKWQGLGAKVFYRGAQLTATYADELVVDAHAIGERWKEVFGRGGVYIPYGGHERETLPLKDDLPPQGYVLVVARFVPENTIPEFFDAAESLAKSWPVVIVGSTGFGGELDQRAESLAASNPNIHWFGHVSDDDRLHALWQHAGVYFHGHSVGGTNPALVQAMALGAPIVARDTMFNREVLGEDAGRYAPPFSEAICRIISEVMSSASTRDRLSSAAISRAKGPFSWPSVCARYEASLLALL